MKTMSLCFVLVILLFGLQFGTNAQPSVITASNIGTPVLISGEVLFYIHNNIGPFTKEDRARAIKERLTIILNDPLKRMAPVVTDDNGVYANIQIEDLIITTVTNDDAKIAGKTRQQLSAEYALTIQNFIDKNAKYTRVRSILIAIVLSIVTTGMLILVFRLLQRLFPWIYGKSGRWLYNHFQSIKIQDFEIMTVSRMVTIIIGSMRVFHGILIIMMFYFYVSFVLSLFPWTSNFADRLVGYVLIKLKSFGQIFIAYLPNLFTIAVIIFVAFYIIRFVRLIFYEIRKESIRIPGFDTDWAMPTYKFVRFIIILIAIIASLSNIPGSDSPVFMGVSIFFGVIFLIASFPFIMNIAAGLIIVYTRAFTTGDNIKVANVTGRVLERSLLSTRIHTEENADIIIPNSLIIRHRIANFGSSIRSDSNHNHDLP